MVAIYIPTIISLHFTLASVDFVVRSAHEVSVVGAFFVT